MVFLFVLKVWFCNGLAINDQWSLEQIKGHSKLKGKKKVSHERIYQLISSDKSLQIHTRHKLKQRKRPIKGKHQIIKDKGFLTERLELSFLIELTQFYFIIYYICGFLKLLL